MIYGKMLRIMLGMPKKNGRHFFFFYPLAYLGNGNSDYNFSYNFVVTHE